MRVTHIPGEEISEFFDILSKVFENGLKRLPKMIDFFYIWNVDWKFVWIWLNVNLSPGIDFKSIEIEKNHYGSFSACNR